MPAGPAAALPQPAVRPAAGPGRHARRGPADHPGGDAGRRAVAARPAPAIAASRRGGASRAWPRATPARRGARTATCPPVELRRRWPLDRTATGPVDDAMDRGQLTARGYGRVVRLAWTLADLRRCASAGRGARRPRARVPAGRPRSPWWPHDRDPRTGRPGRAVPHRRARRRRGARRCPHRRRRRGVGGAAPRGARRPGLPGGAAGHRAARRRLRPRGRPGRRSRLRGAPGLPWRPRVADGTARLRGAGRPRRPAAGAVGPRALAAGRGRGALGRGRRRSCRDAATASTSPPSSPATCPAGARASSAAGRTASTPPPTGARCTPESPRPSPCWPAASTSPTRAATTACSHEVARTGLVVSELPPGSHPTRRRFLVRNRLIAALSLGTVVVEAASRSGSLATLERARLLDRHLMAVPGPVTSAMSRGCHDWLRDGAVCVTDGARGAGPGRPARWRRGRTRPRTGRRARRAVRHRPPRARRAPRPAVRGGVGRSRSPPASRRSSCSRSCRRCVAHGLVERTPDGWRLTALGAGTVGSDAATARPVGGAERRRGPVARRDPPAPIRGPLDPARSASPEPLRPGALTPRGPPATVRR